jgi:hypothetical protein
MLRWMMPCLVAVFAIGSAEAADGPVATRRAAYQAAKQLPPGLPRPHYAYRTTITAAPPRYVRRGRQLVVEEYPTVVVSPIVPYIPLVNGEPILPGSSSLPGYYGNHFSYSYDGPYYGGPYYGGPYWNRLPYACGVYGYC